MRSSSTSLAVGLSGAYLSLAGIVGTLVAAVPVTVGGWLGGVLVSRNQISVDHRYARSGKWKEERIEAGRSGRTEAGYVAFDDRCPHRGGSLAGGAMIGGVVQCPWHGSQFDCRSGAVKAGPAEEGIATYRVTEGEGRVLLRLNAER